MGPGGAIYRMNLAAKGGGVNLSPKDALVLVRTRYMWHTPHTYAMLCMPLLCYVSLHGRHVRLVVAILAYTPCMCYVIG